MAAASGIWNHASPVSSLASGHPAATTTGSSGTSSTDGSTISANDFLTLLVTEMQNQDPTANTDPNEYINQLVQVNSLEQLININQTLSTDLAATTGLQRDPVVNILPGSSSASAAGTAPTDAGTHPAGAASAPSSAIGAIGNTINTTAGNLGVPDTNPAAQRVAQALTHRAHLD